MIEIKQLSWSENASDELWMKGTFSTLNDIFEDAIDSGIKPGETIAIAEAIPYMPQIDVCDVLEKVEQDAYEECGDAAEQWLEFKRGYVRSDELQIEMQRVFVEWLQKTNQMPSFYKLEHIRTVVVPEVSS